jgi:hypothetical protein
MDEERRDLILHKRVRRIADKHDCLRSEVNAVALAANLSECGIILS